MVSKGKIEREMARGRGFLSSADRKWLLMPREEYIEEHSRQYWGQRRDELQNRVYDAILDFSLLWEHWDRDERWDRRAWWTVRGAEGVRPYDEQIEDQALEDGLRDMSAFALFLARADPLFRPEEPNYANTPYIEQFLLFVFRQLGREYRRYVRDYELHIDGEDLMWDKIRQQIEDGEEVPVGKLALALELDTLGIDPEPVREALQEEVRNQLAENYTE